MNLYLFAVIAVCGFSIAAPGFAQNRESTLAALIKLAPAERQARILDALFRDTFKTAQ